MLRQILLALTLATSAHAQGFAGLGTDAPGFAQPQPNPTFTFPADHGPHPNYRIEWWYLTATLQGPDGTDYGAQWTLFRSALAPETANGWEAPQLFMGHAGLTTPTDHFSAERLARGGTGQAGVTADPFAARIDDWHMTSIATTGDAYDALHLTARGDTFAYDLQLTAQGPLVFHGDNGFSVKSAEGQASYYYSQPFYTVTGQLDLPTGPVQVAGTAWLDREWSSQPLSDNQQGWDWFSLQFPDGARMMAFGLRQTDGSTFTSGTWIDPDGTEHPFGDGVLEMTPTTITDVDGRQIPTGWRLDWPERGLAIVTVAVNPNSCINTSFPFWYGPIRFSVCHDGIGYLEMTGYE